jgi:uroporphyrinogen decarboxylase
MSMSDRAKNKKEMTSRERFVETLNFGQPDRIFYAFGYPRRSTMNAWYLQGLPRWPDVDDHGRPDEYFGFVGMDRILGLPIKTGPWPPFEVRIIEEGEQGRIWVNEQGITMHDAGMGLKTPGFRTRSYLSHPVKDRKDWIRMRDERFDPHAPGRYPDDWPEWVEKLRDRKLPIQLGIYGLYWKARDWVGFENLSLMFYDCPRLVHDMMEHVTDFFMALLDRALGEVKVDAVMIAEDMCFKQHAMISPKMFREFMLPRYKRWVDFFRGHGVPLIMVDSDGYIDELIPLWIEAGVNGTSPVEIAAGNDPVTYRKKYGQAIAFWGGIDKREIRSKERTYREVMNKVPWLLEQGGYLPGFDHGVPPDVPLRAFLYMCELIKALAEGRPVPGPEEPLEIEDRLGPIERMWSPDENLQ